MKNGPHGRGMGAIDGQTVMSGRRQAKSCLLQNMIDWRHSGFNVYCGTNISSDNTRAIKHQLIKVRIAPDRNTIYPSRMAFSALI